MSLHVCMLSTAEEVLVFDLAANGAKTKKSGDLHSLDHTTSVITE